MGVRVGVKLGGGMEHDMPAKDAARWGGPAGWRLQLGKPLWGRDA